MRPMGFELSVLFTLMLGQVSRDFGGEQRNLVLEKRLEVRVQASPTALIFQCVSPCFLPLLLEKLVKFVGPLPHLFQRRASHRMSISETSPQSRAENKVKN